MQHFMNIMHICNITTTIDKFIYLCVLQWDLELMFGTTRERAGMLVPFQNAYNGFYIVNVFPGKYFFISLV